MLDTRIVRVAVAIFSKDSFASRTFNLELLRPYILLLEVCVPIFDAHCVDGAIAVYEDIVFVEGRPLMVGHATIVCTIDLLWDFAVDDAIIDLCFKSTWRLRAGEKGRLRVVGLWLSLQVRHHLAEVRHLLSRHGGLQTVGRWAVRIPVPYVITCSSNKSRSCPKQGEEYKSTKESGEESPNQSGHLPETGSDIMFRLLARLMVQPDFTFSTNHLSTKSRVRTGKLEQPVGPRGWGDMRNPTLGGTAPACHSG